MDKQKKKMDVTLVVVLGGDKILLGERKRKDGFGDGLYNTFGGRLEEGETVEEGALRELTEESGLVATEHEKIGLVVFDVLYKGEPTLMTMHIYKVTKFDGEPVETDEARPVWFDLDKIPYDKMFPDAAYWLPLVLDGKKIVAAFKLDDESLGVLEHNIEIVKNLP